MNLLARVYVLFTPFILRQRLRKGCSYLAWPFLSFLARIYRLRLRGRVSIVAVVGSLGKTSTTRALAEVLNCTGFSLSGRNSWSYVALGILGLRRASRFAVFEVGVARKGQMAKYASVVRPDVTVVTSVGSEHLRSMKNLEGVRAEKSKMVEKMNRDGLAVLNGDDPHVLWMREKTEASVVTYGFRETNDVMASEFVIDWPHGTRFKLHLSGVSREVKAPLIGRNMVRSVLAAVAVASALGIELETSLRRLDGLTPAPGRLQPLALYNGAWILRDDHKSGIETILTAVETLAQIPAPRKLAVMGDITEESGGVRALYRRIGGELAGIVELLLLVGRHSRSISVGARRAGLPAEAVIDCAKDIFRAAEFLRDFLEPGDLVLLKGRFEQRLQRIALSLQGRDVRCKVSSCNIMGLHCESCPALGKGWPAMIRQV